MPPPGRPEAPDPHDRRPVIAAVAVALVVAAAVPTVVFVRDGRDADPAHPQQQPLSAVADLSGQSQVVGGTEATRRALLDGGIDL